MILPRHSQDQMDIHRVASRVLDELIAPMRDVALDDHEFACLKAIVFFDPGRCTDIDPTGALAGLYFRSKLKGLDLGCI